MVNLKNQLENYEMKLIEEQRQLKIEIMRRRSTAILNIS